MKPALVLLAALAAAGAQAQTVQRCEGPDGKVTYADGPCPSGTTSVRTLPPAGASSAADQKAAQERSRRAVQAAEQAERQRRAEEAQIARARAQEDAKARKRDAHCRRLESRLRLAQEDLAAAALGKRAEAQRRVRRAEALVAEDCGPVR